MRAVCDCIAGKGGLCKHIAALVYFINNEDGHSKTSEPQAWGKPSKMKTKYSKGKRMEELFPPQKEKTRDDELHVEEIGLPNIACPLSDYLTSEREDHTRITEDQREATRTVEEPNKELSHVINYILDVKCKCDINETPIRLSSILEEDCLILYYADMCPNREEVIRIAIQTAAQSSSLLWFKVRENRITASTAHSVWTRRKLDKSFAQIFYENQIKNFHSKATHYGKANEKKALQEYSEVEGVNVVETGVIINLNKPWLCASPDGIVLRDGIPSKILEIKCPYSCRKTNIVNVENSTCNVKYLKYTNGSVKLKKTHNYYTQCQLLLYSTGLQVCDLYVFSPKQSILILVHRDDQFIDQVLKKLEEFYFFHLWPYIVSRNLALCP